MEKALDHVHLGLALGTAMASRLFPHEVNHQIGVLTKLRMEVIAQVEPTRIDVRLPGVNFKFLVGVFTQDLNHQEAPIRASQSCHIIRGVAEALLVGVRIHMGSETRELHVKEPGQLGIQCQLADILPPALTNPADKSLLARYLMAQ